MKEYDWNKIQAGFSRIIPEKHLKFDVDLSGKTTVYISIITEDGIKIADGLPREPNKNIIIGADEHIYDSKAGETWVDESGICHLPDKGESRYVSLFLCLSLCLSRFSLAKRNKHR